jgi:phage terminase large subunit GpA-like protein
LKPPPTLTVAQWADEKAYLSPESSSQAGKWHNIPYQVGIMNAHTEPGIERTSVMKSARIGYTKIINNIIGYHIDLDPCSVLVVQPTVNDAEGYSKDEVAPMLRDTPCLDGKVGDAKSKDGGNTILKKNYPGGTLTIVGANSARGFRRLTVRGVLFDEVDAYPHSAGNEGDPIKLGEKRTTTDPNRFIILGSTPTLDEFSRIQKAFEASDKRYYFLPCPHCKHFQVLKWGGPKKNYGIKWPEGYPDAAYYECEHCHDAIDFSFQSWMVANGQWRATALFFCCNEEQTPTVWGENGRALCRPCGSPSKTTHAGFHIWAAYSPFPNAKWSVLVEEFLAAKRDREQLQVFINTVLGECWKEEATELSWEPLFRRREPYGPEIPQGACVLVAGVDVQDDRLEMQTVAVGVGEELWPIAYDIYRGDPGDSGVWERLTQALDRVYQHANGTALEVMACAIDTGGHYTTDVYDYVKQNEWRCIAIKGGKDPAGPAVKRPSKDNLGGVHLYTLGVNTIKHKLARRLQYRHHGPGFIHFPVLEEFNEEYFQQLTAEKAIKRMVNNILVSVFEKPHSSVRNETWDTLVYAYAALLILNPELVLLPENPVAVKAQSVPSIEGCVKSSWMSNAL